METTTTQADPKKLTTLKAVLDPKLIEKQNKEFQKLSKKQRRLAIARDVLSQLRAKKFIAQTGIYLRADDLKNEEAAEPVDLQCFLLQTNPQCTVCGIGAAVCSLARLGDEVQYGSEGAFRDNTDYHGKLRPVFSEKQIHLIEWAFEGRETTDEAYDFLSTKERLSAEKFFTKHPNTDKRLAAIFRNIVKNNGTFKP